MIPFFTSAIAAMPVWLFVYFYRDGHLLGVIRGFQEFNMPNRVKFPIFPRAGTIFAGAILFPAAEFVLVTWRACFRLAKIELEFGNPNSEMT